RYQAKHQRAYSQAFKQIQQLQTNGFIRPTLPDEVEADIPVLADVQQVHFAKRNQREAWPTPVEAMMDQVERDAQAAQRDSRAMDGLKKMAS
ncbi:MAG: hypothetical protein GY953_06560, partial [bacterium]|nr:hypothetical protein [bacterium]